MQKNLQCVVLAFTLSCFMAFSSNAQSLQRNYFNGFRLQPAPDSLVKTIQPAIRQGLQVLDVLPGGTAEMAQIKAGDIVLTVNGQPIATAADFRKGSLAQLKAGQTVQYTVWRKGSMVKLKAIAKGRPSETGEGLEYEYGEVSYGNGRLRSLLSKPAGSTEKLPAILFIQGYTCSPSTDLEATHPYKRLTDGLSKGGYAVLRLEKPGVGDSEGTSPCNQINFQEETLAFDEALQALRKRTDIDTSRIFIWGHSMGGMIAPVIAAKYPWVKGVMVYGTIASVWSEYLLRLMRTQAEGYGRAPVEIEKNQRLLQHALHEVYTLQKSPADVAKALPQLKNVLTDLLDWDEAANTMFTRSVAYFQTLHNTDITLQWSRVQSRVLAMYGEADIEAIGPDGAESIVRTVNYYHPGLASFYLVPGTDHSFAKVGSQKEGFRTKALPDYGDIMIEKFNPEVIQTSLQWMRTGSVPASGS